MFGAVAYLPPSLADSSTFCEAWPRFQIGFPQKSGPGPHPPPIQTTQTTKSDQSRVPFRLMGLVLMAEMRIYGKGR
jgi:hypothetical protein